MEETRIRTGGTTVKIRELQKCDSLLFYVDLCVKWSENGISG